jgi:hypothetical protein
MEWSDVVPNRSLGFPVLEFPHPQSGVEARRRVRQGLRKVAAGRPNCHVVQSVESSVPRVSQPASLWPLVEIAPRRQETDPVLARFRKSARMVPSIPVVIALCIASRFGEHSNILIR